jgi:Fur family transcriptional regulator, peroxide stress response regulator
MHHNLDKRLDIQEKLKAFENACKEAGLKFTHQRREIFRELALALDHPSAETLHSRLKEKLPTLSIDTVYRTLTTLEKQGLIKKVQTVESQARFEVNRQHHHHLICNNCHEITDFDWKMFDESLPPNEISDWGRINHKKVILHGLCRKCSQKN